jgi:hypothetical protein
VSTKPAEAVTPGTESVVELTGRLSNVSRWPLVKGGARTLNGASAVEWYGMNGPPSEPAWSWLIQPTAKVERIPDLTSVFMRLFIAIVIG